MVGAVCVSVKAHVDIYAESGLVHTVLGSSGNALLHGQETEVFANAGYQGAPSGAVRPNVPAKPADKEFMGTVLHRRLP